MLPHTHVEVGMAGVGLSLGWAYIWGELISGVSLALGWAYLWGELISGVGLSLG